MGHNPVYTNAPAFAIAIALRRSVLLRRRFIHVGSYTMSPITSFAAVGLSMLALTVGSTTAFIVPSAFTTSASQVLHASPAATHTRSTCAPPRMVAAPDKVATTGVKRNENFGKLKVIARRARWSLC